MEKVEKKAFFQDIVSCHVVRLLVESCLGSNLVGRHFMGVLCLITLVLSFYWIDTKGI